MRSANSSDLKEVALDVFRGYELPANPFHAAGLAVRMSWARASHFDDMQPTDAHILPEKRSSISSVWAQLHINSAVRQQFPYVQATEHEAIIRPADMTGDLWRKRGTAEGDRLHYPLSQPARSRDMLAWMLDMADHWDAEADAYEIDS